MCVKIIKKIGIALLVSCLWINSGYATKVLNVYIWASYIPRELIKRFQQQTGIKVNVATFDTNEELYTKLRVAGNTGYDLIMPSSYYVMRMQRAGLLQAVSHQRLKNFLNIDKRFLNRAYDPGNQFCVPYMWGFTGIFVNRHYIKHPVRRWQDLWLPEFANQLLLLNDPREVFSMALKSLGYSANDNNPQHLKQAYQKLLTLRDNIKLFNDDAVIPIATDADVWIGMMWNGDLAKAQQGNKNLTFIYPDDGYVIWLDTFAIPKGAPHLANAYRFIDFMLRPKNVAIISNNAAYPTVVKGVKQYLLPELQHNGIVYPSDKDFAKGEFQTDLNDNALALITHYWELLKINL